MDGNIKLPYPRWIPLLLGFFINAAVGMTTYSWSLFIKPLNQEFGWTRTEIALAFSICCLTYGMVSFIAGRLTDRYGPRAVVFFGGLLLGAGFISTGYVETKLGLYLTYGIMAGGGAGLIYLPPVGLAPQWWPDRKAVATGVIVLGLGVGSFFMAPISSYIIQTMGWRYVFIYCGIAMSLFACVSALFLQAPPKGWIPPGWDPEHTEGKKQGKRIEYTHKESIGTKQFWMLYLAYFCTSTAGLLVTSHIAAFGQDQGLNLAQATGAVGALAIMNAATRLGSGFFVDQFGIRRYFIGISALQVVMLLTLAFVGNNYLLLSVNSALIGWNYGAIFTIFPVYCLQYFGQKAQNSNYGLLFTAWGIAGFFGPFSGGWFRDLSGNYTLPFILAAMIAAVALVVIAKLKPPPPKVQEIGETVKL